MSTVKINENIDLTMRERAPSSLRTISVARSSFLNPKLLLHKEREVAQSKIVFEKDFLPLESHFPKVHTFVPGLTRWAEEETQILQKVLSNYQKFC